MARSTHLGIGQSPRNDGPNRGVGGDQEARSDPGETAVSKIEYHQSHKETDSKWPVFRSYLFNG